MKKRKRKSKLRQVREWPVLLMVQLHPTRILLEEWR